MENPFTKLLIFGLLGNLTITIVQWRWQGILSEKSIIYCLAEIVMLLCATPIDRCFDEIILISKDSFAILSRHTRY